MKLTSAELTNIITVIICLGSVIAWGIKMEVSISKNHAYASQNEKVQAVKWEALDKTLQEIRKDITLLETKVK